MKLDELRPAPGATHRRKRIGRGPGSGGVKGAGFEGGQMPLYRRLPKRGFLPFGGKTRYAIVNVKALGGFSAGSVIDPDGLVQAGLIKRSDRSRVKILGDGDVANTLTVRVHAISASARTKIEGRGGRVEVLAIKEKVTAS